MVESDKVIRFHRLLFILPLKILADDVTCCLKVMGFLSCNFKILSRCCGLRVNDSKTELIRLVHEEFYH